LIFILISYSHRWFILNLPEGDGLNFEKEIKIVVLSIAVVTLLCLTAYGPVQCSAAVVWSENFDNPLSDWTLWGCDADDGYLLINGSVKDPGGNPICSAYRSSTVANGTWEFDILELGETHGWMGVWFMAESSDFYTGSFYEVRLTRSSTATGSIPVFGLYRSLDGTKVKLGSYDGPESPLGTHHIKVSRSPNGRIMVKVNDTLRIDETDTEIDSSAYFVYFAVTMEAALDNIVVDDEFPDGIPWEMILLAAGAAVIIIVGIVVVKRRG